MKAIAAILIFVLASGTDLAGQQKDSLLVMFWNMENFFDYRDGGEGESDNEFSSMGLRHWTKKRFYAKCNAVAKSIYWISDKYGDFPDIIGLAEIENSNVLYRLLKDTSLKKTDYAFIHYDGCDRRGIDVAFLYRKSVLEPLSVTRRIPLYENGDTVVTRDILHVEMKVVGSCKNNSIYHFIVNHHPSKYGGAKESHPKRIAAMNTLKALSDSLLTLRNGSIIAMGDFNDTPDSEIFDIIRGTLDNKASALADRGQGTIRYEGKWDMIDMFLVDYQTSADAQMSVEMIPFLMVKDTRHPGMKPFRTYSGPRHIGGVSDHCPILLGINLLN